MLPYTVASNGYAHAGACAARPMVRTDIASTDPSHALSSPPLAGHKASGFLLAQAAKARRIYRHAFARLFLTPNTDTSSALSRRGTRHKLTHNHVWRSRSLLPHKKRTPTFTFSSLALLCLHNSPCVLSVLRLRKFLFLLTRPCDVAIYVAHVSHRNLTLARNLATPTRPLPVIVLDS